LDAEFLGVGWRFPVQPDADGRIMTARYEETIRQSIWTILSTAPGERVMRPDFGCDIHSLVFEPNQPGTLSRAVGMVRDSLLQWEPRIDVLNVDVTAEPNVSSRILLTISYQVRATNSRFNLVYPFYVEL
jgi:phage baseplate assembly protein W